MMLIEPPRTDTDYEAFVSDLLRGVSINVGLPVHDSGPPAWECVCGFRGAVQPCPDCGADIILGFGLAGGPGFGE